MTVELIRDATRESGWWLLVDGAEQSYVDCTDPLHLEFEYVQMIGHILDACCPGDAPLSALHLGGGLCTVPRWLAARHPGSRQRIVERSAEIAQLSASLGSIRGATVRIDDALAVVSRARRSTADVVVCDVYDGPDTVTEMFTVDAVERVRWLLRDGGIYLCNLSDATPFALTRVVAATLRDRFGSAAMLAEPAVLRARRSGNLVFVAADRELPVADLSRRGAGNAVRFRVVSGEPLTEFIGAAQPAEDAGELPASGESTGHALR